MRRSAVRRLAFVGPLPPVRSGIADYAADLLPHLAERCGAIEIFVGPDHPCLAGGRFGSLPVRPARELRERAASFEAIVYQIGNNLHHEFVFELAEQYPGVVVLHDVVVHHLYEHMAGVTDDWSRYGAALREAYGAVGDEILRWKRWRLASDRENFLFPLFEPLVARSRGVMVHNRVAETEVLRRVPEAAVRRVPMGIPQDAVGDRDGARRRLGLASDEVVVGVFGFLTPIKRIDVLARALGAAWRRRPEMRVVLVGEASPGLDLGAIFPAADRGRVLEVGYAAPDVYRDWMAAVDVAVNLRYPTAGETSASLLRLLGAGKCTLVSAYGQFLEIPPDAVVRVPLGADEESSLARSLVELAGDRERRERIGAAARRHVATEHSMEAAADAFVDAIGGLGSAPAPLARPQEPLRSIRRTSRAAAVRGSAERVGGGALVGDPGAEIEIELCVRNQGESRWLASVEPAGGQVALGIEVASAAGVVVERRVAAALARDLAPGGQATVTIRFAAPPAAGDYAVQPLLVHVGRGRPLRAGAAIPLTVVPGRS